VTSPISRICPGQISREMKVIDKYMTRINLDYPVEKLTTKHLIAEHREIKRIPNQVVSGRVKVKHIDKFCLGKGHVHFFTDRLGYLLKRYKQVYQECLYRGFNVQDYSGAWVGVPPELMNDYQSTAEDRKLIEDRIRERLEL
jgi:deoxyribonuclease (pyrimidine dimer)